jgi:hypothetical protein
LRLLHSSRRVASDGDCICPKLHWKSCQFARRHAGGMVNYRKRIGASIDMVGRQSLYWRA